MKNHYVIGCGGVGSWLVPALLKLVGRDSTITLIDGDTLEPKNLDRQLFDATYMGRGKATALADKYNNASIIDLNGWYSFGSIEHSPSDWLFVCVDNHPARLDALRACDRYGCKAIFAANETHSAEAFIYQRKWKGTRLDPRIYYPEIETDRSDDPRSHSIGCTGEAQESRPQLVSANLQAASLALHLYVAWAMELPKLEPREESEPHFPHKLEATLTKLNSYKTGTL